MSATLVNLIIQLISGAAGSGVLARMVSQLNLGPIGNLITGALGGVGGGNILGSLLGAGTAAATGGGDLGSILTQIVGGGVGGPILTAIVALIRNATAGQVSVTKKTSCYVICLTATTPSVAWLGSSSISHHWRNMHTFREGQSNKSTSYPG